MRTCACCGQEIRADARAAVCVDDAVLTLCNRAFDAARAQGAAEVEIAHVLVEAVNCATCVAALVQQGFIADAVIAQAERWLQDLRVPKEQNLGPRTSADLKTLLRRAEAAAKRLGRTHAGLVDLMSVLAGADDLATAQFLRGVRGEVRHDHQAQQRRLGDRPLARSVRDYERRWTVAATVRPNVSSTQQARSRIAEPAMADRGDSGAPRAPVAQNAIDVAELVSRLAQTERALEEMRARFGGAVFASSSARNDRLSARGFRSRLTSREKRRSRFRSRLRQRVRRQGRFSWVPFVRVSAFDPRQRLRQRGLRDGLRAGRRTSLSLMPRRRSMRNARRAERVNDEDEIDRVEEAKPLAEREKRFYLALDDDVVRAPSIGNRTAERLRALGVVLVRDLLEADAGDISSRIGVRYITPLRVTAWQAQARLVCVVPWLRGTHAQLFVGAGYATVAAITAAEPTDICAAILRFATTRDGQSVLRAGSPPDIERVLKWVQYAALAEPERLTRAA